MSVCGLQHSFGVLDQTNAELGYLRAIEFADDSRSAFHIHSPDRSAPVDFHSRQRDTQCAKRFVGVSTTSRRTRRTGISSEGACQPRVRAQTLSSAPSASDSVAPSNRSPSSKPWHPCWQLATGYRPRSGRKYLILSSEVCRVVYRPSNLRKFVVADSTR